MRRFIAGEDRQQATLLPDCLDDLAKATDEAALAGRFGRGNVLATEVEAAEDETVRGTAIFPKDPGRRPGVSWQDTAKRRGLAGQGYVRHRERT